jgi:ribosomal protein S14
MGTSFEIKGTPGGAYAVQMPRRCVSCGAPQTTESTLALSRLVMRKNRQVPLEFRLGVPHCEACARATKSLFLIGLIPALLGFLLAGGAVFVAVVYGAWTIGLDEYARPQDTPSLVLGAFFGLLAGIVGGLLFELVVRLVLLPFLGRAMLRSPLLVVQLLADSDYVAGLRGAFSKNGESLLLTFENSVIAQEFAELNHIR